MRFNFTRQLVLTTLIAGSVAMMSSSGVAQSEQQLDESCWDLSFSDEFDALSLWNPEKKEGTWKTSYIWDRDIRINNELQYYVDPEIHKVSPFLTDDGILTISASRTPELIKSDVQGSEYISGALTTEKSFSQQYGRFEASAKMPRGKGLWPAFWLLPTFDQWPEGVAILPEIDVMEYLGHEPDIYHTTLHTNQTGKFTSHQYDQNPHVDLSEDFHLYTVVWDKTTVNWYFDGDKVASHPTPADYTRPMHFLLNLAVGGNWPGSPDARTRFPAEYKIDFVKAYKRKSQCG